MMKFLEELERGRDDLSEQIFIVSESICFGQFDCFFSALSGACIVVQLGSYRKKIEEIPKQFLESLFHWSFWQLKHLYI